MITAKGSSAPVTVRMPVVAVPSAPQPASSPARKPASSVSSSFGSFFFSAGRSRETVIVENEVWSSR